MLELVIMRKPLLCFRYVYLIYTRKRNVYSVHVQARWRSAPCTAVKFRVLIIWQTYAPSLSPAPVLRLCLDLRPLLERVAMP